MLSSKEHFLSLVRLGIGHCAYALPKNIDWQDIRVLAEKQGLYAIVIDGIERLPIGDRPPHILLLEWIGEVFQGYEYRYEQYCKALAELAGFYNSHSYRMMVLKGYACSLDWPKPNHRPCGDIDIWQFGEYKKADDLLTKEKGIKVDNSHHHHTVFNWGEFTVENHYDFVNIHARQSSEDLEKIFKKLGQDDSHYADVYGENIYLPSPDLHALFLIKHAVSHFVGANISLRQVLDWAFFVEKHTKEIDWDWLIGIVDKYHMLDFYNSINAICVENLGFESTIFPHVQFNPFLKDKVLEDILTPKFGAVEPKHLIPRLFYKYRRWQGNAWKHEMCYKESRWSEFWSGVKNHLMKPASI